MSLKGVAKETLKILEEGQYLTESGRVVNLLKEQQAAVAGTRLYTPEQGMELLAKQVDCEADTGSVKTGLVIEVTNETTQRAAHRLVQQECCNELVLLNYASARNPGGGFINGSKAQEEDLARCSGLYPCLLTQPQYYSVNRAESSLLYTDHVIYSPRVPWFRLESRSVLENFFLASVITAPAPNAGEALRLDEDSWPAIEQTLRRRAGIVLAIARAQQHRNLLLGAWGCGVFRNRPAMVADIFAEWLASRQFRGAFDRVVFAVYDRSEDQANLTTFKKRFPSN